MLAVRTTGLYRLVASSNFLVCTTTEATCVGGGSEAAARQLERAIIKPLKTVGGVHADIVPQNKIFF